MIKMSMPSYDEWPQNIYALNLSYLLLAQRLIKQDRFTASFYLGMSDEFIDVMDNLSLPQLIRLASSDRLICQLRIDNESVLNSVTKASRLEALQGIHAGIILSTKILNIVKKEEAAPAPISHVSNKIRSVKQACTV